MKKTSRTLLATLAATLAAALLAPPLDAQTASSASPASPKDETVLELSPFVTTAAADRGYAATSSLAGTRIRTDLRDIANAISVVTSDFMKDVNATDSASLLVYTANTETAGSGGNYSGGSLNGTFIDQVGPARAPQNNSRVRGLASADLTRDYFPTTMVFDSYNTERVEISRGPNATLFGLGSPGGIINNQLVRPTLKNKNRVEFGLGSFGTQRAVADFDRVLIPGVFGLRVALLDENAKFQQNYTHEKDRRVFASLHLSPFKDGTLRASFERGNIDANRPRTNSPRDTLTKWFQTPFNKVTHSPGTVDFNQINRDIVRAPGEWFAQPAVIYPSNNASAPSQLQLAWYTLVGRPVSATNAAAFQANMVSITTGSQYYPSATAAAQGIKFGSFFMDPEVGDTSIFDWRNQLLDGPNKREWEDFHVGNVSYDQHWKHALGTVGFEAALNREKHTRNYYDLFAAGRGYAINIDINTTLPWGAPNPNFGRPFMASKGTRSTTGENRSSDRLTAFLELDFARQTERLQWLGRHNFTGFANRFTYDEQNFSGTNRTDLGWVLQARAAVNPVTARDDINSEDGTVRTVVYLGPSLANATTAAGANLQGIQTELNPANVTGWAWDPTSRTFVTRPVEVSRIINDDVFYNQSSGGSLVRQVISSQSAVHQARWLKGEWIVSTLGWRKDEVKSYRKNADNDVRNQYNFIDRASPNFRLPSIPGSVFEQAIWSHGIVVHRPPFLKIFRSVDFSVFYSKSENFQPADARISIFGQPIEPPGGTTNDRGFTLGFLGGKISTRFNWFETASARATDTYPGFLIETDARIMRYNTPAALAAAGYKGPPQFLKTLVNWQEFSGPPTGSAPSGVNVTYATPGNVRDTTSTASKGFEFEGIYNPTTQWRMAFNVSQQQASQADIAPATQEYLKLRLAEWTTDKAANLISDESGQPVRIRVYDTLINALNGKLARSGQKVSELREWRANFVGNYTFARDSRLRGWSLGSGLRWQDKVGIGYPIIASTIAGKVVNVPDLQRPYYGPSEFAVDGWVGYTRKIWQNRINWRLQLNVRNLLDDDTLIPAAAQPDGSIASWFAPQGRTFMLRSTFEF
jgi:outer membrane receptor protein involved in Fe transport